MIQAYYKYRPASLGALALLVCADGKDRAAQLYHADMLRLLVGAYYESKPPRLCDIFNGKGGMTAEKANAFVDKMFRTFGKAA